jgi:hypothetical protein
MLEYENYVLTRDMDYFGKTIPKGTIYFRCKGNADIFIPEYDGNYCPSESLHFTRLVNNEEYFILLQAAVLPTHLREKERITGERRK